MKNQKVPKKQMNLKKESKIKKLLNSVHTILIFLIIFIVILLVYVNYVTKSNKVYIFNGKDDFVSINNGVVALNYDINIIEGSDITYLKEKDIVITSYKIGYYVKNGDNLISLAVLADEDEEGLSLKAILEGISSYNLYELNSNKKYFTKEAKKYLNNGLYFVIEATTKAGDEITNMTEMSVTKISK